MIRKVDMKDAGKSISGTHKRSKRLPFRTEADKRGVEVSSTNWSHCIRTVAIPYDYHKKSCS